MLGRTIVPDGHAIGLPREPHLVLGDARLALEVAEEVGGARHLVEAEAHILGRVVVDEVGGEAADVQHLLAGFGVGAHHRVLGGRMLLGERAALLGRHHRAEGVLDAVAGEERIDLGLDLVGQVPVGLHHVDPDGVAAHRRALDAAQHAAHGRILAPQAVGNRNKVV